MVNVRPMIINGLQCDQWKIDGEFNFTDVVRKILCQLIPRAKRRTLQKVPKCGTYLSSEYPSKYVTNTFYKL